MFQFFGSKRTDSFYQFLTKYWPFPDGQNHFLAAREGSVIIATSAITCQEFPARSDGAETRHDVTCHELVTGCHADVTLWHLNQRDIGKISTLCLCWIFCVTLVKYFRSLWIIVTRANIVTGLKSCHKRRCDLGECREATEPGVATPGAGIHGAHHRMLPPLLRPETDNLSFLQLEHYHHLGIHKWEEKILGYDYSIKERGEFRLLIVEFLKEL